MCYRILFKSILSYNFFQIDLNNGQRKSKYTNKFSIKQFRKLQYSFRCKKKNEKNAANSKLHKKKFINNSEITVKISICRKILVCSSFNIIYTWVSWIERIIVSINMVKISIETFQKIIGRMILKKSCCLAFQNISVVWNMSNENI